MKITEDVYLVGSGAAGVCCSHKCDCNVYALSCGDEYLLVDCGVGREPERLKGNLEADGIPPGKVRRLLLTHYHLDHCGGARWFRQTYGLEVWASAETAEALEKGDEEVISLAAAKRAGVYPEDFGLEACPVDRILQGGETLVAGDASIEVLRTPGHSRDMVSYLVHRSGRTLLFSGDTVFHGGKILLSALHDCDVPAYCESLRLLASREADSLFPGHMLWAATDGHSHLSRAVDWLDRLLLPPNLL